MLFQVYRLYRNSLKLLNSWVIDQIIFNEEAILLRARFDDNRDVNSPAATRLLREGKEEAFEHMHSDPHCVPWMVSVLYPLPHPSIVRQVKLTLPQFNFLSRADPRHRWWCVSLMVTIPQMLLRLRSILIWVCAKLKLKKVQSAKSLLISALSLWLKK